MNIIEWRVSGTGQLTKTNWSIPPSPRHLIIHCRHALIVLRPFLLRELNTFLPPGVAILALKPIFFFLLSLLG